ncbi:MAG: hypothetical protein CM15mP86_16030 [Gammaproteobacteria bacterium]|nr:MAG: hypothetical protein CM15mP86_16030 [Gammaproteobacteria bacterium]
MQPIPICHKRLIGRKHDDDVVKKDSDMVPYKIISADNGDAWVEAEGKKLAPQQVSAEILKKMKKTAEDYLGQEVKRQLLQYLHISMIPKDKLLKMLEK